jgi:hypothetical protein
MATADLETLIRRASGADPLAPWSASDAAELAAYTYGGTVFLRREGEEPDAPERTALRVGLVMRLGDHGRIDGVALSAGTGAVHAALARGGAPEAAFAAGLATYAALTGSLGPWICDDCGRTSQGDDGGAPNDYCECGTGEFVAKAEAKR